MQSQDEPQVTSGLLDPSQVASHRFVPHDSAAFVQVAWGLSKQCIRHGPVLHESVASVQLSFPSQSTSQG